MTNDQWLRWIVNHDLLRTGCAFEGDLVEGSGGGVLEVDVDFHELGSSDGGHGARRTAPLESAAFAE